jgi:Homeodomain-like domain
MPKKYIVRLTDAEREMLNGLIKQRRAAAQKVLRAHVLLKADADGPHWTDAEIAHAFDCRTQTIENMRERFVTEGFEITLSGKPKRRVRGKVLDGIQEAKIIALRLGPPPPGFANWTLRLLAAQAVALELVESVSHETLRRTLKKTILPPGRSHIGSFRRPPMPSLQQVWRTCLRSMPNPMMRGIRYCAWMSNRYSS